MADADPFVIVAWWGPARGAPAARDRLEVHVEPDGRRVAVLVRDREVVFVTELPRARVGV